MYIDPNTNAAASIALNLRSLFEKCINASYIELNGSASCASAFNNGNLELFFESSNGAEDWLNNLNFFSTPYKDMSPEWQVHRGFLNVWGYAKPYVKEKLDGLPLRSVTIIGYSHGAAIALLCHEFIWYNYPQHRANLQSFGFGCPKVLKSGNTIDMIKDRWDTFFRVSNLDDFVTHLPPESLGFTHVGHLVEIGEKGRYSCYDCPDLKAHHPSSYLQVLTELAERRAKSGITLE